MRTLYESILDSDLDVDKAVIPTAIKDVLDEASWDMFDGEFELRDDALVISWNDSFAAREILFNELYDGIQNLKKIFNVNIRTISFGKHSVILHVGRNRTFENLKIWARSITIEDYIYGSAPIKVWFDNCDFNVTDGLMFNRIEASMKKTNIRCNQLNLRNSKISGANVEAVSINILTPHKSLLNRLKRLGLMDAFKNGIAKELPEDTQIKLLSIDPIKDILGLNSKNKIERIAISIDQNSSNDCGFVILPIHSYMRADTKYCYQINQNSTPIYYLHITYKTSRNMW